MALMNLFAGQQWRNRHREQTRVEGRRGRGRCMDRVTWKFTMLYVKWMASGNLLYDSGTQTVAL